MGTKSQHLQTHENVGGTCPRDMLQRHVPSCEMTASMVHSFGNAQHALRHTTTVVELKWRPSKENRLRIILELKILKIAVRFLVLPRARAHWNKPIRS